MRYNGYTFKRGIPMLVVIPVSEGETFTAYSDYLGEYVEGQNGLTLDQLKALGDANDVSTDGVDGMTPQERWLWLVETVGYYSFTALAVVDTSKLDAISIAADVIDGGDSSRSFEMFNRVVIASAEKTIPIFGDIIEVDPDY
jgi:hypothetical protein